MPVSDKFHYLPKSSEVSKVTDNASERLQLYKKHLKNGISGLIEQFKKGTSISQLLKARSAFVDNILKASWNQFQIDTKCCLVAIGGYGRQELQPFSDVDILILIEKTSATENLESWIAFLWDIGLEVGHSVRTLNDCHELSQDDISIATSLMESRHLTGNAALYKSLING